MQKVKTGYLRSEEKGCTIHIVNTADVSLMSREMTLLKRSTCSFSSVDTHVLPRKAKEIPQFQETFRSQEMGLKLRRLLLGSGGLATLSLPAGCDVWSWGERCSFSLVSLRTHGPFLSQSQRNALFDVLPLVHKAICSCFNTVIIK